MNLFEQYLVDEIIRYKKMRDDLIEMEGDIDNEDYDNTVLYDGIVEGLSIALQKSKEIITIYKTHVD